MTIREITPRELQTMLATGAERPLLLDVREPWEAEIAQLPGSMLIPLRSLPQRLQEIPASEEVAIYCHHGMRSLAAAEFLAGHGYTVMSLAGGIDLWSREIDPAIAKY